MGEIPLRKNEILIEHADFFEESTAGESSVSPAFPTVLKAALLGIKGTRTNIDAAKSSVEIHRWSDADRRPPQHSRREFVKIGHQDSIRSVAPIGLGEGREGRPPVETALVPGGMELESLEQAGVAGFKAFKLGGILSVGENHGGSEIEKAACDHSRPGNMMALAARFEKQDSHGQPSARVRTASASRS